MRERLFPRWCTALFTLLPMSELLYLPADGQSVYAAALACTVCALAGIGAARLSDRVRHSAPAQWVLACNGLNRCAMWALPIAWLAGTVLLLSGVLTFTQLTPASFSAPTAALLPQFRHILYSLLPASVVLAFSLPETRLSASVSRGLSAGGALLALLLLRTVLLLGANTAALLPYPAFTAAGLAAIGNFARHGEVFFAVPLLLCEIGRCAALVCVLLYPFTRTCGVLHLRRPQ